MTFLRSGIGRLAGRSREPAETFPCDPNICIRRLSEETLIFIAAAAAELKPPKLNLRRPPSFT